uniref:F5/8 type C domain-containing protein n=1 Tax=Magallana gigas TaxID=29159 RepID=A0A8W8HL54_MAGGI
MIPGIQDRCILLIIVVGLMATVLGCNEYLVDTVTDDKLTASSIYDDNYLAAKARLSSTGWSPEKQEHDPWIQVDFGRPLTIVAVVTKGLDFNNYDVYVKKYKVRYSNTSVNWTMVFNGTNDYFFINHIHKFVFVNDSYHCEYSDHYRHFVFTSNFYQYEYPNDYHDFVFTNHNQHFVSTNHFYHFKYANQYQHIVFARYSHYFNNYTYFYDFGCPIIYYFYTKHSNHSSPATSTAVGATQFADTTFKPTLFNSTQVGFCTCICTETNDSMTPQKVQARIETIVQNLTVSKKKTSKYIRSKTSAQDSRPEVVYVGSVAIAMLCMFASLIVLPDLYTLLRFIYAMLKCKEK